MFSYIDMHALNSETWKIQVFPLVNKYNGGFNSQIWSFWPDLNAFDWWHHCWCHRKLQRVPAGPQVKRPKPLVCCCLCICYSSDGLGPFQINTFYFHKTIIIHQLKWACLVLGEAGGICRLLWMIWKYERFWRTTLQYHLFRYFWVASRFYLLYITQALIFPLGATFVPWNWLIAEINLYRREDPRLWDYS